MTKVKLGDEFRITALEIHLLLMLTDYDSQAVAIAEKVFERKVEE